MVRDNLTRLRTSGRKKSFLQRMTSISCPYLNDYHSVLQILSGEIAGNHEEHPPVRT